MRSYIALSVGVAVMAGLVSADDFDKQNNIIFDSLSLLDPSFHDGFVYTWGDADNFKTKASSSYDILCEKGAECTVQFTASTKVSKLNSDTLRATIGEFTLDVSFVEEFTKTPLGIMAASGGSNGMQVVGKFGNVGSGSAVALKAAGRLHGKAVNIARWFRNMEVRLVYGGTSKNKDPRDIKMDRLPAPAGSPAPAPAAVSAASAPTTPSAGGSGGEKCNCAPDINIGDANAIDRSTYRACVEASAKQQGSTESGELTQIIEQTGTAGQQPY